MNDAAAEAGDLNQEDPFLIPTHTLFGRKLIINMTSTLQGHPRLQNFKRLPKDFRRPEVPGRTRNRDIIRQLHNAFVRRLFSALIGGIALVDPMLLMLLHKTLSPVSSLSLYVFSFLGSAWRISHVILFLVIL
jgi:hypothetical protein